MWYVCSNLLGYAGLNLMIMSEPAQGYEDTLYGFQSQPTKCFAITVYRINKLQMFEPTEGDSYVISTSSNNSCAI